MPVGRLAPWYGSKATLASAIVRELGPHTKYDEPFCGSCAVLLGKRPAACETVNDLNGELINLARVLKIERLAVDLYGRLSRVLMHEDLYHEIAEKMKSRGLRPSPTDPDVDEAADFMLWTWFGRNGVAGTKSYNQGFCVRYTKRGGHQATRWLSAINSIPAWHERLRAVTILNRDGFELLERLEDSAGCAIYCDPPYVQKGAQYLYDFDEADHGRLARLLNRFKRARVVVSYYEHAIIPALYPNWSTIKINVSKAMVSAGMRDQNGATKAPEILLVNN